MVMEVLSESHPPPTPVWRLPVGSVLVHPQPTDQNPGRPQNPSDPNATRLVRVAVASEHEWPWRRLTGIASEVPSQWSDLSGWRRQSLAELGEVLGA